MQDFVKSREIRAKGKKHRRAEETRKLLGGDPKQVWLSLAVGCCYQLLQWLPFLQRYICWG